MKLERLSDHKLKIFLTFDDLYEHGLTVDDLKRNEMKIHVKIQQMVEQACDEINFQIKGAIGIEIYSLHTQGLMMIITRDEDLCFLDDDELFNMQMLMEEQLEIIYAFQTFEDVIQLCKILNRIQSVEESSVYYLDESYYLRIEKIQSDQYDNVIALVAEFGTLSTLTIFQLVEYGKLIIEDIAIEEIANTFT